jgi:uncharacterized protein
MNRKSATIIGLCVALMGPALLVSPLGSILGESGNLTTNLLEQVSLWVLFALVIGIVRLWEKLPLSSVGFRFQWQSFAWGLLLAAVLIFSNPLFVWLLAKTGIAGFEDGLAKLRGLPVWFLVLAAVTAGVAEETLYRGYAIERLALFVGSYWWAGLIALTVFALVHLPFWGWGPVLVIFMSGTLITAFYIWKRDLLACIVAHAATDAVGLISVAHAS